MRKAVLVFLCCIATCFFAYRWSGIELSSVKIVAMEHFYIEVSHLMLPYIHKSISGSTVCQDVEQMLIPAIADYRETGKRVPVGQGGTGNGGNGEEGVGENKDDVNDGIIGWGDDGDKDGLGDGKDNGEGGAGGSEDGADDGDGNGGGNGVGGDGNGTGDIPASGFPTVQKQVTINRTKLQDFDYLCQNFYQVDNTTTVNSKLLDVSKFLGKDMRLKEGVEGPQVLIYHTHSQEAYADSKPGDASTSILAVGDYLEKLLETRYGISVLHHKGEYDVPDRDGAYSNALPELEKILEENPTIEVVIDLHRDAVPETMDMDIEINGKQTAKLMFFNGISRTTSRGELEHLPNPNLEDNLAFSFQMQLVAAEYYPGLTRPIYLRGYRYNLHLRPKSILVEVGAQNNTLEEALNAMEPLADILQKVLYNIIE